MKVFAIAAALGLAAPAFSYSNTYTLIHDSRYDNRHKSLSGVTCAHGEHGVLTHEHTTFGSLPSFPGIGGAPQIRNEHSPYCGACFELTYIDKHHVSRSINFTAIAAGDHGSDTFTISSEGFDRLTDGPWYEDNSPKSIHVTAVRKPAHWCGL